jgi:short-subunit dehydrogenase
VERRVCDLADRAALDALCRELTDFRAPALELFAAAGFGQRGSFSELSATLQADMLTVNVSARLRLMHALIPIMRSQKWGRIVLISSSSAFQPMPGMATYAASNAALLLLGEAVAAEVADDGIEVLTVCPGGMSTGFQKRAGVHEAKGEKLMTPEAVAEEILGGLGKGRMTIMPSARSKAMAMLARVLPRRTSVQLWGHLMRTLR